VRPAAAAVLRDVLVEVGGAVVHPAHIAPRKVRRHSGKGDVVLGSGARDNGLETASTFHLIAQEWQSRGCRRTPAVNARKRRNGKVAHGVVFASSNNFKPTIGAPVGAVAAMGVRALRCM
jgi:hypothetical protein